MEKMNNQIALIWSLDVSISEERNNIDKVVKRIQDYRNKISDLKSEIISDIAPSLRGWEGNASRNYFSIINLTLPEKYKFNGRSQHPATDVFNCLLNYGYGMLYGKIEGALIKAGLDPYIGIFHREDYNRPVLVFDIIEKYRVWIDYVVINLLCQKVIDEDCYSIKDDGAYWLEAIGKRILIQSINDYFDELINISGKDRSRLNHIHGFASKTARNMLNFKPRKL